jgi:hypothetical protein
VTSGQRNCWQGVGAAGPAPVQRVGADLEEDLAGGCRRAGAAALALPPARDTPVSRVMPSSRIQRNPGRAVSWLVVDGMASGY